MLLPLPFFQQLEKEWDNRLGDLLDCEDVDLGDGVCSTNVSCPEIEDKLEDLHLTIGDYVFTMKPKAYIQDAFFLDESLEGQCMFVIAPVPEKLKLDKVLLGDPFMVHFLTEFDFEKMCVKLGVKPNSESLVSISKIPMESTKVYLIAMGVALATSLLGLTLGIRK